ncbi:MAG TPA: hypothetical protein VK737_10515 [Opitutales bacterium]|jgi:hypothetical protein|nr:hypothetical protein [Opitutales bacterium]
MSHFRPTALFAAAALVLAVDGLAHAQSTAAVRPPLLSQDTYHPAHSTTRPDWVDAPLVPTGHAHISRIAEGQADVVVLDGGLYQGFRNGVLCVIMRKDAAVAQLVVVATEEDRSAALITNQNGLSSPLMPGDEVRVSTMSAQ